MSPRKIQVIPLNRVEGDLEVHLELESGAVAEARSVGTMYRGFENLLVGRAPLDGLVITPRICGICSTAHLKAAAKALDRVFGVAVPDNAKRVRNVTLMVEQLQNDLRHSFLLFMPDTTRSAYRHLDLYAESMARYEPLKGSTARQVIRKTKQLLEIIAILGGQWPHSSFMVPGGVVSVPTANDVNQCRSLLNNFSAWYQERILGCTLDRWRAVKDRGGLFAWLDESDAHRNSDLGYFIRFAQQAGLEGLGRGPGNFISYGALEMPSETGVACPGRAGDCFIPAGFARGKDPEPFDPQKIAEDITFARFEGYTGGRHPFDGLTRPVAEVGESGKYSWAKAPRYDGNPAETGPLAEMILAGEPLFVDLVDSGGPNVFSRQLARLVRPAILLPALDLWLAEIPGNSEGFFANYTGIDEGSGYGLTQAHRGALGHWLKIKDGVISHYQVITPTAWNASPRDGNGNRGPWEEALIGTEIKNPDRPIEVEHIIRSFDPCLVCTVHAIDGPAVYEYPITV